MLPTQELSFFYELQKQFVKFGGFLKDSEKVIEIIPGDIVSVRTEKGLYRTRTVILTPGIRK